MEIAFRHKGRLYNQHYAWIPTQVSSGLWTWLTPYYSREVKGRGWVSFTPFEFVLDSSED